MFPEYSRIGVSAETPSDARKRVVAVEGADQVRIDPVREEPEPFFADAFRAQPREHALGDARDPVEAPHETALDPQHQLAQPLLAKHAEVESGIHFQVLNVQPRARAAQARGQPCRGRARERRLHDHDHLRPPRDGLPENHRQARKRERHQMQQALEPARPFRHPQRAAEHFRARDALGLIAMRRVTGTHRPLRIIRRRRHDTDVEARLAHPGCHVADIFADAGELGREVNRDDQYPHGRARSPVPICFGGRGY